MVAPCVPPTGDLAWNPGMHPDWELNQWPFGSQASVHSTELYQPEPNFILSMWLSNLQHHLLKRLLSISLFFFYVERFWHPVRISCASVFGILAGHTVVPFVLHSWPYNFHKTQTDKISQLLSRLVFCVISLDNVQWETLIEKSFGST